MSDVEFLEEPTEEQKTETDKFKNSLSKYLDPEKLSEHQIPVKSSELLIDGSEPPNLIEMVKQKEAIRKQRYGK